MAVVFAQPIEEYPTHLALGTAPTMTNVDSNYPASKLITYDPTAVARTTTGSTVITWNFGLAREFDIISLLYSNVSHAATIVVEASSNGSSWTTLQASRPFGHIAQVYPVAGQGNKRPRRGQLLRNHSWYYSSTTQTWQYIRITVTDPNVANMTFGRLFVGKSFSPSTGMQYGSSFTFSDYGTKERTDRGALVMDSTTNVIVGAQIRTEFLTSTEMYDYVYEFEYWRGSAREMLVCLDTTDVARLHKNILYCVINEGRTISSDTFNNYSKTWILEVWLK